MELADNAMTTLEISTHAPAGGATSGDDAIFLGGVRFLLTPLREGRRSASSTFSATTPNFYSRPCGRGDPMTSTTTEKTWKFLLTPLREGRPAAQEHTRCRPQISTHAPAGGATPARRKLKAGNIFLLTPLREGRPTCPQSSPAKGGYFYSRPCGRGDGNFPQVRHEVLRQIAER